MEYLTASVDKFVFRVARGYRYAEADIWARREAGHVRVGLTDFLQQKSGDIAFIDLKQIGTVVAAGDELAVVETIKADLVVPSPLAGRITNVNGAFAAHPELVNADPYGEGWLVEIEPSNPAEYDALLDAETYLPRMAERAEMERRE